MSESLKLRGHLKHVANPKPYGTEGKELHKFYIDIDKGDKYETAAEFTVFGDKIPLSEFKVGDMVDVRFSISGKSWQNPETQKTSFFQSLIAFDMTRVEENTSKSQAADLTPEAGDDLPFVVTILLAVGSMVSMVI